MDKKQKKPKLITAKQVQEEYLNVDIRKVRAFLNANCRFRKIGKQYYYVRDEVEQKLIREEKNVTYSTKPNVRAYIPQGGMRKCLIT